MRYIELGAHKQLNEIVFAGSHDAGITGGSRNEKTQSLDIAGQAAAGVRLFDLRIGAAASGSSNGTKTAELRAFHGGLKHEQKTRLIGGQTQVIDRNKLKYGTWGLGLEGMLEDARRFVSGKHSSEFLILKFDKCSNWPLIAETCVRVLGPCIYTGTGNLNTKTLGQLALFDGMQYFGKGGTSVAKPFGKIGQNVSKQSKLMRAGGGEDPNVMGMMYWTTTGLFESIKDRNDTMWTATKVDALKNLWTSGLSESIESRLADYVDPTSHAYGTVLKAFMPNIVMIDFADPKKCQTIYALNQAAATSLTNAAQTVADIHKKYTELQKNMGRRAV